MNTCFRVTISNNTNTCIQGAQLQAKGVSVKDNWLYGSEIDQRSLIDRGRRKVKANCDAFWGKATKLFDSNKFKINYLSAHCTEGAQDFIQILPSKSYSSLSIQFNVSV